MGENWSPHASPSRSGSFHSTDFLASRHTFPYRIKSSSPANQTRFQALIPDDSASDPDPTNRAHQSENVEKPDDYGNHDNDIQDHPDLMIHWYVVVDEPQQHSNNPERNDE